MEALVKKYRQKFRKAREEMDRWDELQSRLVSEFRDASSIICRLPIIRDFDNYGTLKGVDGILDALVGKQMESLQTIFVSMNKTLEEFRGVVSQLERLQHEGMQLVKGASSSKLSTKQLQLRVGVNPCLADCGNGLMLLHQMYSSEYGLKSSIVSAISKLSSKPSSSDLGQLLQLLVDQPNIPADKVELIFNIIFANETRSVNIH